MLTTLLSLLALSHLFSFSPLHLALPGCLGWPKLAVAAEEDEPNVWIGVRLTPVPAPLAAHVGQQGVMIANVVKDGPADKAGLEQYDVVIRVGDKDITRPQDLADAIRAAEPGRALKLKLVRKAQPRELEITPVERPRDGDWKLKYAEPEDTALSDIIKMRGLTLKHGPGGQWFLRDLGQLKDLPDALKELEELDIKLDLPEFAWPPCFEDETEVEVLGEPDEGQEREPKEEKHVRVEVRVQVEDDGKCTTIVTHPDGKISVTRKDADGQESSATYDSREDFKKADPEGYKLYSRHAPRRPWISILSRPHADQARKLQREYQIDIEKKFRDALERAREAGAKAAEKYDKARREAAKRHFVFRSGKSEAAEPLLVRVRDDGSLTVVVAKEDGKVTHEFKSKEAFRTAEPELYERVKSLLE